MANVSPCLICGQEMSPGTYRMVAFDKPYLNIFIHKDCYANISQEEFINKVLLWYNNNRNGEQNAGKHGKIKRK